MTAPTALEADPSPTCRGCGSGDRAIVVDLGVSPPSNKLVAVEARLHAEPFYPLCLLICRQCLLVQVDEFVSPGVLFSDYLYFSSYSSIWLAHSKAYADMAIQRYGLGANSKVVELASNDGYLLQYFAAAGVPVLGIEPAANVAARAIDKGIPTISEFFGEAMADALVTSGHRADLIVANNVWAHVPDLHGFTEGIRRLLKPTGVVTIEFSHVLRMMQRNQFDSIYHEHFCYFSLRVARQVLAAHGLEVFDVDELSTHGGSLRVHAAPVDAGRHIAAAVDRILAEEDAEGLGDVSSYLTFGARVEAVKRDLLDLLIDAKRRGKSIVGYGAAAKGNTLLNYCGIRTDFLDYVADLSPYKQGRLLPGTRIPVVDPARIVETKPDLILLLAWNLADEITEQLDFARAWGAQFIVPLPSPRVIA